MARRSKRSKRRKRALPKNVVQRVPSVPYLPEKVIRAGLKYHSELKVERAEHVWNYVFGSCDTLSTYAYNDEADTDLVETDRDPQEALKGAMKVTIEILLFEQKNPGVFLSAAAKAVQARFKAEVDLEIESKREWYLEGSEDFQEWMGSVEIERKKDESPEDFWDRRMETTPQGKFILNILNIGAMQSTLDEEYEHWSHYDLKKEYIKLTDRCYFPPIFK